jgi:hypothetical protein
VHGVFQDTQGAVRDCSDSDVRRPFDQVSELITQSKDNVAHVVGLGSEGDLHLW